MTINLIKSLSHAEAFPHSVENITVKETHISWIILTGQQAYKIKKPVNLGFLDFSTLEQRKFFCEEEIRLNKRLSPDIYLSVVPVTQQGNAITVDGQGTIIDYAVKMKQFPENAELDFHLSHQQLNNDILDELAEVIANFHINLPPLAPDTRLGTASINHQVTLACFDNIFPRVSNPAIKQRVLNVYHWLENTFLLKRNIMDERMLAGKVRECHGDLHLGNIALIENNVRVFDGIEFSEKLRCIDIISEVAFTYMDLFHYNKRIASRFINHYLEFTGDYQGLSLLHYYVVYRAIVRAMVALIRMDQSVVEDEMLNANFQQFLSYLAVAEHFTKTTEPMLVICHGLSGSGKTTASQDLLEELPAIRLRSDVERKRIFDYSLYEKTKSGVNENLYSTSASEKTYEKLFELSKILLGNKFNVIVDATFLDRDRRDRFYRLSRQLGASFIIMNFKVPEKILRQRLTERAKNQKEVSEADIAILEHQLSKLQPLSWEEKKFTYDIEFGKPFNSEKFTHEFSTE